MSDKRIISAALTGNWGTKETNPNIPMSSEEIAQSAYEAWQAGAAVVHLHMRDELMRPTMDVTRFKTCISLIRKKCNVLINITSSGDHRGATIGNYDTRCLPFREIKPEMGSFDAGTMNWMNSCIFENHPLFLEELGKTMQKNDVKPELEIFDGGMIYSTLHYVKKGVLKTPCHYQFVLGCPGGMDATVDNLVFLHNLLPEGSTWSATGIGRGHLPIMMAALAMGGHVRVGLEDNVYYTKGVLAKSNAQLVERAASLVRAGGMEVATPDDACQILGIQRKAYSF